MESKNANITNVYLNEHSTSTSSIISFAHNNTTTIINADNGASESITKDWTDAEEIKVTRKVDSFLMPLLFFAFFILQVDRGNISNALTSTLKEDVGLDNNKINVGTALFNIGIVVFEIPSNILLQKFGPSRWLSFQIVAWSLCATLQSCMTDYRTFLVTRFFMGVLESGYIPGGLYYISTWYTKSQLPLRYTIYFIGNLCASATGSLIAAGILKNVAGTYGLLGWQWIFIIEGVIGIGYGLIFALLIPNSPKDPCPFWKGFRMFTERESKIIRGRVLLDDPEKISSSENISLADLKDALLQWRIWLHFIFTFAFMQNTQALSTYVPSIVVSLGYSAVSANAMSSIGSWCSTVMLVLLTLLSYYINVKFISIGFITLWQTVFTIALFSISNSDRNNLKFALLTCLITSGAIGHVLNCSWISINVSKPKHRSIAMALLVMAANMAGICAGQILRTNDTPKYHNAFLALSVVSIFSLLVVSCITFQYIWSNRKLEKKYPSLNNQIGEESSTAETKAKKNDNTIVVVGKIEDESHMESLLFNFSNKGQHVEKYQNGTVINHEKFRYLI